MVHFVDLIGNLELPPSAVPIVVDDFTREEKDSEAFTMSTTANGMLHRRAKASAGIIKILSSDCVVRFLVVEDRQKVFFIHGSYR